MSIEEEMAELRREVAALRQQVRRPRKNACKRCNGSGKQPGLHNSCGRCRGSGVEQ